MQRGRSEEIAGMCFHIVCGVGGGAGSVFSDESLFCACFKSYGCTFGLRFLSMIVVPTRCMTFSTSLICTVDCLCNVLCF